MEGNGQLKKKTMHRKGEEVLAGLRVDHTESSRVICTRLNSIRIIRKYIRIMYQRIAAWHFRNSCESLAMGRRKQEKGNEREENTKKMLKMLKDVAIVNIQFKIFNILFFMFGQLCSKRAAVERCAQEGGWGWAEAVPSGDLVLGCSGGRSQPGLRLCTNQHPHIAPTCSSHPPFLF